MDILIAKKPPVKDYWGGFDNDFDDIPDALLSEADQVSMLESARSDWDNEPK